MRLLIAASGAASDAAAVPPSITALIDAASHIHVVTATVVSRLDWLTGDIDEARHVADERLATILGHLASSDASVSGSRGDEDPMAAFGDAIRDFNPDHILIGYPEQNRGAWQSKNLVEKLSERHKIPITLFEVP